MGAHAEASRARIRGFLERRWLLMLLAAAVPAIEWLADRQGGPGPSVALVRNPFAAIAAATVFCRYLILDFRGRTRRWIVYLTPVTWIAALAFEGTGAPPAMLWLDMLVGLGGLGVFGFMLAAYASEDRAARSSYLGQLGDALLLPLGASMCSYGLWATFRVNPVFDPRIYAFEEILGVRFSLMSARSFLWLRPLSAVASACYNLIAVGIALTASAQPTRARGEDVVHATLIAGACGFALYFVAPAVGPEVSFGPFYPWTLPAVPLQPALLMAVEGAPRNGMPSLHTIWALLIWFNTQGLPSVLKRALQVFVVLTLWAVMSPQGTHWFMDIVVSIPIAVAVQSAVLWRKVESAQRTWTTAGVSAAVAAMWLVGFRLGTPLLEMTPVFAWTAVLATIGWPLSRYHSSVRAVRAEPRVAAQPAVWPLGANP
jgi:hypothetical protein